MVSWLEKISSGNESRAERENDEMSVPNYRYRDWIMSITKNISIFDFESCFISNDRIDRIFWIWHSGAVIWNWNSEHFMRLTLMMIMNCFLWDGWPTSSQQPYFQKGPWSGSLTIKTSQHTEVEMNPRLMKQPSIVLPLYHGATLFNCGNMNINMTIKKMKPESYSEPNQTSKMKKLHLSCFTGF